MKKQYNFVFIFILYTVKCKIINMINLKILFHIQKIDIITILLKFRF